MQVLTLTLAVIGASMGASEAKVEWSGDYGRALNQCELEGMPLLIIVDRPADEGQRVQQVSHTVDTTQHALLSEYILCHVDATTEYGKQVAEAFKVTSYPYTAVIDRSASKIVYRKAGTFETSEWVNMLVKYKTADATLSNYASSATKSGYCRSCRR